MPNQWCSSRIGPSKAAFPNESQALGWHYQGPWTCFPTLLWSLENLHSSRFLGCFSSWPCGFLSICSLWRMQDQNDRASLAKRGNCLDGWEISVNSCRADSGCKGISANRVKEAGPTHALGALHLPFIAPALLKGWIQPFTHQTSVEHLLWASHCPGCCEFSIIWTEYFKLITRMDV